MKKMATVASAALLAFSAMSVQAQIEPVSDQALSEVDGQLSLSLRFSLTDETVRKAARIGAGLSAVYVAHEVVEGAARLGVASLGAAYVVHEIVEGPSGLVAAYVVKEVIVGEILGEALSIEEDFRTRLNLIDAFRPGNT